MNRVKYDCISVTCSEIIRKRPFEIVAFKVDPEGVNSHLHKQAVQLAKRQKGTILAPGGSVRDEEHLFKTRYLGALSELALVGFFKDWLGEEFKIQRDENFKGYEEHVDITVAKKDKVCTLEVRGSFPYSPLKRVICELFNIIGPYTTCYKPCERPKDFYLCTLINEEIDKFEVQKPHELYFVGGAEYSLFEKIGEKTDLKQEGAQYLGIKPIARARDSKEIVELIKKRFVD